MKLMLKQVHVYVEYKKKTFFKISKNSHWGGASCATLDSIIRLYIYLNYSHSFPNVNNITKLLSAVFWVKFIYKPTTFIFQSADFA